MMQEVGNDEASNGESTFEFVERKTEDLHLGSSESGGLEESRTPRASFGETSLHPSGPPPTGTYVTSGSGHVHSMPIQSFSSPITSNSVTYSVPPPAALPAFLTPYKANNQNPAEPPIDFTRPYQPVSSPYVTPSTFSQNQPTNPLLPGSGSSALYNPVVQQQPHLGADSTTLELPLIEGDYSGVSTYVTHPDQNVGGSNVGAGMWGWIKGTVSSNDFLHRVAEKAKNSVDSMITTLDPQMKQYIYSGGDVDVVVASDKEDKVGPIRDSFQLVFGRATVTGIAAQSNVAAQPVGFSAGIKGAEGRIAQLRQSGRIDQRQPCVAVQNFLAELTPERWFDIGCLVLDDPAIGAPLHVYTQAIPVPLDCINVLSEQTMADYPLRWSGFALTVGSVLGGTHPSSPFDWRRKLCGIPRCDMVFAASKTLATLYKQKSPVPGVGTTL